MHKFLAGIALIIITPFSMAAEWFLMPTLSSEQIALFFDKNTFTRDRSKVTVWLLSELSEKTPKELGIVSAVNKFEIDCANRTKRMLRSIVYKKDGKSESSSGTMSHEEVIPGSMGEMQLEVFCEPNFLRKNNPAYSPLEELSTREVAEIFFKFMSEYRQVPAK